MELRHLRYFVATVEEGTVRGAAERLHLTQPGLSRQLRQLETELGVALFDRTSGRLAVSRTGRALVPAARELLLRAEAFGRAAAFHARGQLARVTVAASTVSLTDVVAPFIAGLSPDDPVVDVLVADGLSAGEALARGADLAIGPVHPGAPYDSLLLADLPLWAYVPAGHPWAGQEVVDLDQLVDHPLVVLPATFPARQVLDAALLELGAAAPIRTEAANGTVAQALAAAGRGVAVVSDDPRFGLVPRPVQAPHGRLQVRLVAAWDGRHAASGLMRELAQRLSGFVIERYGASG